MTERKFDYIPRTDPRNAEFPVRTLLGAVPPVNKYWYTGPVLDQGSEGACVGHGVTGAVMAAPIYTKLAHPQQTAFGYYHLARYLDEWAGESYDGTSVLGGLKAAYEAGSISQYRWCYGLDEVLNTVATLGPVVIGVDWYNSMLDCPANGLQPVDPGSGVAGGHCVFITGVAKARYFAGGGTFDVVRIRQSWGKSFGNYGNIYVKFADLGLLLRSGEAALPIL